jgi:sulfoxide reductase catalytic subunit YedY
MFIRKTPDVAAAEVTPRGLYLRRREFLHAFGATAAAAAAGVLAPHDAGAAPQTGTLTVTRKMVTTDDPLTPYDAVTTYNNFYEFGSGKDEPAQNAKPFHSRPWSVSVEGECARPGMYDLEDILRPHPLEERIYRLRCVEGWSMVIPWVGFPLGDLLKRFEPTGNAKFVELRTVYRPGEMVGQRQRFVSSLSSWPYKEGLRIDEAMHPLAIMAVGVYGEPLPNQNGAPLRLVVPWKYGFKSIKSIDGIRFLRRRPRTSWQEEWPEAYGFYANVNPTVAHPRYSQATERRLGELFKRRTSMFNGYAEQVESLYAGMNLSRDY